MWTIKTKIFYILYKITAAWLPVTYHFRPGGKLRKFWFSKITGNKEKNMNIERMAQFTPGLKIGNGTGIGSDCEIWASGGVTIGENVMMGPEVIMYTQNHKYWKENGELHFKGYESKSVNIGNNVWIGRRAMFMAGSGIGDNAIVAAGAVVTKKFPDNVMIGGSPAKVLKEL